MRAKFNKTKRSTQYFPITQHRFDTSKHPIISDSSKRSAKLLVTFTYNEMQMVEGLAKILQCEASDAIRIAIYEFDADEPDTSKSEPGPTRDYPINVKMPGSEKRQVVGAAKAESVSHGTLIRTAVRWLAEGIKGETIKRLKKSRKISQDVLAKRWKEENVKEKAPGKLKALHKAHNKAYEDAAEKGRQRDTDQYEERGLWLEVNPQYFGMLGAGLISTNDIDQLIQIEAQEQLDHLSKEEKTEFFAGLWGDEELAKEMMKEEEEEEPMSYEEIEATEQMLDEWLEEFKNDFKGGDD